MLDFPLKQTDKLEYLKPARNYITKYYEQNAWRHVERYVQEMDRNRAQASISTNLSQDQLQGALNCLASYNRRLLAIEPRLPTVQLKLTFKWQDSISRRKIQSSNYSFEKANILYNIAIIYSRMGNNCDLSTADGPKYALNYYQMAAGCLDQVKQFSSEFRNLGVIDLSTEYLSMAINILLGQAYYCMYSKLDKQAPNKTNLIRLAATAAKHYSHAYELVKRDPLVQNFSREYIDAIHFQELTFRAASALWQSFGERDAGRNLGVGYGKGVSRLKLANGLIQQALQLRGIRGEMQNNGRSLAQNIAAQLSEAEQENQTIYMDAVPPSKELPAGEVVSLITPKFPPAIDIQSPPDDVEVLNSLIPPAVMALLAEYKELQHQLLADENNHVSNTSRTVATQLGELELPHKLEALDAKAGVPEATWKKIQECQTMGGVPHIENLMFSLKTLRENNERIVNGLEQMLEKEEKEDNELRSTYGNQWSRATSRAVNEHMRQDVGKYKQKMNEAQLLDQNQLGLYQSVTEILVLLQKSKPELDDLLPVSTVGSFEGNPTVTALQSSLDQLQSKQKELYDELNNLTKAMDNDNILTQLLEAYMQNGNKHDVFRSELAKFQEYTQRISGLQGEISEAMDQVRRSNTSFEQEFRAVHNNPQRVHFLQTLEDAVQKFHELVGNMSQGHQFYQQLTRHLGVLQQKISDFVFSRSIEQSELVESLHGGSGGHPGSGPPAHAHPPPGHQQGPPVPPPSGYMYPGQQPYQYMPYQPYPNQPPQYGYYPQRRKQ